MRLDVCRFRHVQDVSCKIGCMTDMQDGTAAGLLAFLDWTINKGELVVPTATSYRTAVRRVLESEEDSGALDLRSIDLDGTLRRFSNRRRGDFKEQSLSSYAQRFRQAVSMYLAFLDGGEWRPARRAARSPAKPGTLVDDGSAELPTRTRSTETVRKQTASDRDTSAPIGDSRNPAMITFPLPIRPGVRGQLLAPEDLTAHEARRICQVVTALAVGDERAER